MALLTNPDKSPVREKTTKIRSVIHLPFEQLRMIAQRTEKKLLKEVSIFDVYKGDKLPEGKKSYALSFTLQDENQTLTDKQIDGVIQKLITNFEKEVGAEVR